MIENINRFAGETFTLNDEETVIIDNLNVDLLEKRMLCGNPYIKNVFIISTNIIKIPNNSLECCLNLQKVYISPTIRIIGKSAFKKCSNLIDVNCNNIEEIEPYAFSECDKLSELHLDRLKKMHHHALCRCNNLSVVDLKKNIYLTEIPSYCFAQTCNLISIDCNNINTINERAFCRSSIQSISLSDKLSSIGSSAFEQSKIISVDIPESCKYIGNRAFHRCYQLSSVTMHDTSISSIEDNTFSLCYNLKTIIMSNNKNNIINICDEAFYDCFNLSNVILSGNYNINDSAFNNCIYLKNNI